LAYHRTTWMKIHSDKHNICAIYLNHISIVNMDDILMLQTVPQLCFFKVFRNWRHAFIKNLDGHIS
jgi:hypothetical protein